MIIEILNKIGYSNLIDNGDFLRTKPLYRNSKTKTALSINKETGWFTDFGSGESGPITKLIKLTIGCSDDEAKKLADNYHSEEDKIKVETIVEIPEEVDTDEIKNLLPNYYFYNKKGISKDVLVEFESGLCTYGRMSDRFVFPIYNSSKHLVGLAGRDVTGKKDAKWKLKGRKSNFEYPLFKSKRYIIEKNEIILVESIGDMLALWQAGIKNILVLFGTAISTGLIKTILSINPKKIVISTNNDNQENLAGQRAAEKIKKDLLKWFSVETIITRFPDKKDFGEMTAAEILKWAANGGIKV